MRRRDGARQLLLGCVCLSLCAAAACGMCPSYKAPIQFGAVLGKSPADCRRRNTLHYALSDMANRMGNLNGSVFCQHGLVPLVSLLSDTNSVFATAAVCSMLSSGAVALLGPDNSVSNEYVAAIAATTSTPHLELRPVLSITRQRERLKQTSFNNFAVNLHPSIEHVSKCIIDIIDYFEWQEVLVIYENGESLFRLENILSNRRDTKALYFRIKRYVKSTVYYLLKEIEKAGWTKLVLDLSLDSTDHFLRSATNKGLMNHRFHYLLANLDSLSLDLSDYKHNNVNLTALDLVPGDRRNYDRVVASMRDWYAGKGGDDLDWAASYGLLVRGRRLPLASALVYDAVQALASALSNLSISRHISMEMEAPNCEALFHSGAGSGVDGSRRASFGRNLLNFLRAVDLPNGLTGRLRFDGGSRKDLRVDVLHLQADGLKKFANWDSQNASKALNADYSPYNTEFLHPLKNKKLRVVAVATKPFIWIKREYQKRYLENNKIKPNVIFHREHLEGFCIDMMELIANRTGLEWTIQRTDNDTYGKCVPQPGCSKRGACPCQWNGMMADLIEGRADIALGSFTITYEREKAIDFTKPFMNLGISILFKKPKGEKPGLFSFLNPLAVEIWLYVLAAYLVVTLMIYALARFSPYEWINPHPCNSDVGYLVNSFSLSNSFWFTVGTLMQQGSDINPRAVSTRIVGGIWWFFTLIIISSYTANLAAFLTVERMVSPIENAEDLAKQTAIDYGVLAGGSTEAFFDSSHIPTYARMSRYMKERPHLKPKTTTEGIERVKRGDYAFLMESAMIEYHVERECKLVQVGGLIDSKGYGIGIRPNREELRDELTLKILELQRDQELQALKNKWWKETGACRGQDPEESKASALDMHNVGGIFVVLVCGLLLAIFVAVVEFVWNSRKNAEEERQSLCAEMSEELRFSLNCYGSSKKFLDEPGRLSQQQQQQQLEADTDEQEVNGGRLVHRRPDAVFYKETVT